jgi:hypothetical protein
MEKFEEKINRLRDEIAAIRPNKNNLDQQYDLVIEKSTELITLLKKRNSQGKDMRKPLASIDYVPRFLLDYQLRIKSGSKLYTLNSIINSVLDTLDNSAYRT